MMDCPEIHDKYIVTHIPPVLNLWVGFYKMYVTAYILHFQHIAIGVVSLIYSTRASI